jgi:hypothetical protein
MRRVLRKILGPEEEEVTQDWRHLCNEELYDLYCSPNVIQVIKSRRMRWVGHVACRGEKGNAYKVLVGKPEGKNHLKDLHLTRRV